jgi:hypothetical protein
MDTPIDFAAARPGASCRVLSLQSCCKTGSDQSTTQKAESHQPIARCTIDTTMIARTVRPGEWAGPTAKTGEERGQFLLVEIPLLAYGVVRFLHGGSPFKVWQPDSKESG